MLRHKRDREQSSLKRKSDALTQLDLRRDPSASAWTIACPVVTNVTQSIAPKCVRHCCSTIVRPYVLHQEAGLPNRFRIIVEILGKDSVDVHESSAFASPHSGMQQSTQVPKMTGSHAHPHTNTAASPVSACSQPNAFPAASILIC